jgi:hypothetical protein
MFRLPAKTLLELLLAVSGVPAADEIAQPVDPLAAGLRGIVELRQLTQQLIGREQRQAVTGAIVLVFVGQGIHGVRHLQLSRIDSSDELPRLVGDIA